MSLETVWVLAPSSSWYCHGASSETGNGGARLEKEAGAAPKGLALSLGGMTGKSIP